MLSFDHEEDDYHEEIKDKKEEEKNDENEPGNKILKKRKIGKNPSVNTSFLPDRDRDEKLNELKKKFLDEYIKEQELAKSS